MKEKDVRARINAFLRNSLQNLVVPASMGIGLALAACNTSALTSNPDGSGDSSALQPRSGGAGGGLGGTTGTVYGMGGFFRDAGQSDGGGTIDSGAIPEAGKSDRGPGVDTMISEAGVVEPIDAKSIFPPDGFLDE